MNEETTQDTAEQTTPHFDEAQVNYVLNQLRNEQNLSMGIVAGAVAALVGAGIWAAITAGTGFQIGWMAVGIGFLVGLTIRAVGKGIDKSFGIAGAVLSLLGCLAGNLFAVSAVLASAEEVSFLDVVSSLNPSAALELMTLTFSPIDLLFYGIAIYEGYRLSIRQLTDEEFNARITGQGTAV
jgi:hypothetical protein